MDRLPVAGAAEASDCAIIGGLIGRSVACGGRR